MYFEFNIYSSLLLIFFVHLLVYAAMLWRRSMKQESTADQLLASFLFLSALAVIPWMTGFAGWYDNRVGPYRDLLFYIPFVNGLFSGPLLFFYVKAITNFRFRLTPKEWLHFLPGCVYLLWCLVVVVTDKLIVGDYYLVNGETDPDFDRWYQLLQEISIIIYLFAAIKYYRKYKRYAFFEFSFAELASFGWLRNFLVAFGIITILPVIQSVLQLFPFFDDLEYVGTWYYYFAFVLVVYYIAINGYNVQNVPLRRILFEPAQLIQYRSPALLDAGPVSEEAAFEVLENTSNTAAVDELKSKLHYLINDQKIYQQPELTLSELARKLNTNTSVLSKVINQGFGLSFNDYINQFRVAAVLDKLRAGEHKTQTLLGIAFDCGFNSKATFNRVFKKTTAMNPKEWISAMLV